MHFNDLTDKEKEDYKIIAKSKSFDKKYYKKEYNLVKYINPIIHYLKVGVEKGYNPNTEFDTKFYLKHNKDVKNSGMNPFVHYLKYGKKEHRIPKSLTKKEIYDLKLSEENALNYLVISEFGEFDDEYYRENYELGKYKNSIVHYLEVGVEKGYNPNTEFDTKFYLKHNKDVKNSGMNPFVHYLKYGKKEGRSTKPYNTTLELLLDSDLKKTFRGYDGFYFLINDTNCELRQHFDETYISHFNPKEYNEQLNLKRNILSKKDIPYFLFLVPDRSIVCRKFLPFEINKIKRNVDSVNGIIDFTNKISPNEFFKYDTHINYEGGKQLSYCYINHIDPSFSWTAYEKLIKNGEKIIRSHKYDFLLDDNWSYSEEERDSIGITHKEELFIPKNLENLKDNIPNEFLYCGERESNYFKNKNSYSDLKVLIFHDSCTLFIKDYLSFYFREMFLYWDHGTFNKELIEWYNPDMILEIRLERFLENIPIPRWIFEE